MLFNSLEFLFFFPIVTIIYFLIPQRWRWFHLLMASCLFYMFFIPVYIFILIFTIIIDYYAGILIENREGKNRKRFLIMSLLANIGVLAVFKYYNFFIQNFNELFTYLKITTHEIPYLSIILPIGLSFHTFQAMSYTIEVYRGNQKAERHFGIYSLYVMFYPQLVAGPIERPQYLLPQFREKYYFDYLRISDGLKLMAWGLFKKVVIADRLTIIVDQVYKNPHNYHGTGLIIATLFFAFQIYCDFSGYTDIARGAAQVMGFQLMKNFKAPYLSSSVNEFWSRWHISLSSWFKDYLYISLGGNRVTVPRWFFNLFIVFLISGFWHGAKWTFVLWGAFHGILLILEIIKRNIFNCFSIQIKGRIFHYLSILITFILVCGSWIFFRANKLSDLRYILLHFFDNFTLFFNFSKLKNSGVFGNLFGGGITNYSPIDWTLSFILIFFIIITDRIEKKQGIIHYINSLSVYKRWFIYYIILFTIITLGKFGHNQFIYFQF